MYILTGVSNSMFLVSHLPSPHCRVVETIPDANSVLGQIEVVLILIAMQGSRNRGAGGQLTLKYF